MIRRPPRSTRTDTLFPTRRSSDLHALRSRPAFRNLLYAGHRLLHSKLTIGIRRRRTGRTQALARHVARKNLFRTLDLGSPLRRCYCGLSGARNAGDRRLYRRACRTQPVQEKSRGGLNEPFTRLRKTTTKQNKKATRPARTKER